MKYKICIKYRDNDIVEENDYLTNFKGLIDLVTLYTEHTSCSYLNGDDCDFHFDVFCIKED